MRYMPGSAAATPAEHAATEEDENDLLTRLGEYLDEGENHYYDARKR